MIKNKYSLFLIKELFKSIHEIKRFIKFDVQDEFNILQITSSEEYKIVFRCRYDFFEYNVMFFDLCNASNSFQRFINEIFHDFIDDFIVIYLNDILIYFKNARKHHHYVHLIFE